jgi:CheY-like chemotaxis protein
MEEALTAAREGEFDVALLDVNLHGENTGPVAEVLATRGVPFVFATGYGEQGLPEAFRGRPALKKPFQQNGLAQKLRSALDGKG